MILRVAPLNAPPTMIKRKKCSGQVTTGLATETRPPKHTNLEGRVLGEGLSPSSKTAMTS